MSERKVLNKYIPPDFDPDRMAEKRKLLKKIEKRRNKEKNKNKPKKNLMNIRMMYPFTLQCSKCKGFTYVGTKFNSRVEKIPDEHYLNMPIWRFYGKCSECRNEIIFKTDPKNGDYVLVSGGIRTYDANKEQEIADNLYRENNIIREEDKIENTEKQSYNALMELKRNEQLEELQNINKRNVDKIQCINKALLYLSEKNATDNNKDCFYMNNLDPEDERAFFELINKKRTCNSYAENRFPKGLEDGVEEVVEEIVEEEGGEEEEEEEKEKKKKSEQSKEKQSKEKVKEKEEKETKQEGEIETTFGNKKKNVKCAKGKGEEKMEISNMENETKCRTEMGNNRNMFDFKNKLAIKKKNLAAEYNFVVKKKETLCGMLDAYNSSDSGEESEKEQTR